ncbi:MAG TPA: hypothetical protein VFE58_07650 [Tepidisphaeraceae bacterium]|jgi:hypothetical protein|nr:hypothetical protein [Tepidisphaeraceae bacterium]
MTPASRTPPGAASCPLQYIATSEAAAVLILRAYYMMDIFTGIICSIYAHSLCSQLPSYLGATLQHWVG